MPYHTLVHNPILPYHALICQNVKKTQEFDIQHTLVYPKVFAGSTDMALYLQPPFKNTSHLFFLISGAGYFLIFPLPTHPHRNTFMSLQATERQPDYRESTVFTLYFVFSNLNSVILVLRFSTPQYHLLKFSVVTVHHLSCC